MDSRRSLQARIAASSQKDVLLGIFFESTLDHMVATLGAERTDQIRAKILRKVVSFFRYPVGDLLRLLDGAIPETATDEEFDATVTEYGRAAVRFFFASPVGKTMSILAGSNAHRLIASAPSGYKAVTTFGERVYLRRGETHAEVTFTGDLVGCAWQVGVVKEALIQVCGIEANIEVRLLDESAADFVMSVRW